MSLCADALLKKMVLFYRYVVHVNAVPAWFIQFIKTDVNLRGIQDIEQRHVIYKLNEYELIDFVLNLNNTTKHTCIVINNFTNI